jgi:hypothetical protein
MKQQVSKFLEFNSKTLVFLAVNGEYWIALKPICEALNVEYTRTFKNVTADPIFGQLLAEQPMVGADGKSRKMISLPEKWVYGWLISIQSASPELNQYKKLCYEVLNDYFHGAITGRKNLLAQKAKAQADINGIMNRLDPLDAITIERASKVINQVNTKLRALDNELMQEERNLFTQQ